MAALVDRMLAKSPNDRPQSWQEIAETLKKIRQNELYRCKFSSPAPTAAAKGKSESISLIITILAILAGLLIGFLMLRFSGTMDEQVDTEQLLEELAEELKQKK